nr:urocanate hydratase [Deltaproteobacteria bacterium]
LDGSESVDEIIRSAISWDVLGGVARRAWARNENAILVGMKHNEENKTADHLTIPFVANDQLVERVVQGEFEKENDIK